MKHFEFLKKLANTKEVKLEIQKGHKPKLADFTRFVSPKSGPINTIGIFVEKIGNPKMTKCEIIDCETEKVVGFFFIDPKEIKEGEGTTTFKVSPPAVLEENKKYEIRTAK